jgi:hypothetical protein
MGNESKSLSLAEAAKLLSIEPPQYNHFIEIADGQENWKEHERLFLHCNKEE